MPKRSKDASTVLTGDSSLRNVNYVPSLKGSMDEGSDNSISDGESAISSVLSSVKRDLRWKRAYTGSTQSCSTRQSESLMWQDSESDGELYSSSTDEEQDYQSQGSKPASKAKGKQKKPVVSRKANLHDIESVGSTEGTSASDSSVENKSHHRGTEATKASQMQESSKTSCNAKKPKKAKNSIKGEPIKRLRFSTEALGLAAQSRINEARHTLRPKSPVSTPTEKFGRLEHVDYVTDLEVATNNGEISTLHPLGKEECDEVFKNRVPFVVPVSQGSSDDDMSSIHALSTKLQAPIPKQDVEVETTQQDESDITEKGAVAITIPEARIEDPLSQAEEASPAPQGWLLAFFADRSDSELFFSALICASLITLIILLIILFVI